MRVPLVKTLVLLVAVVVMATSCSVTVPDDLVTVGDSVTPPPEPDPTGNTGNNTGSGNTGSGSTSNGNTGESNTGDGQPPGGEPGPMPVIDPAIGPRLASFGPWTARAIEPFGDDRTLEPDTFETSDRVVVTCAPALESRTFSPGAFEEFAAFPFSDAKLPGLIVEGAHIEDGDLRVLPLPRAGLPLVVNLASEAPSVTVDNPSPETLQGAVSELMRTADSRLSGLPVVPANIKFVQKEVSSYEEAVLNMGVSLRYDSPKLRAKFKSDFEQTKGVEKHSVMVRLLQPMFTINVDKSGVFGPGDYFSPATTMGQVDELVASNRLGADNPPVLIDAVTYGRVVYVTVTSSSVTSAEELKVAVQGAYDNFGGESSIQNRNREIIDQAEIRVDAYGGNADVALSALRSGEIQDFMEEVDTATAAPLSMVLRTLDGTKLSFADQATITDYGCTRTTKPNTVQMQIDISGEAWGILSINGERIATTKQNQSRLITLDKWLRDTSNNRIEIDYWPTVCVGGSMTVSFLVNGKAYKGRQWRIAGSAGEWACRETGTWNIDRSAGTVNLADGPPALRQIAGS